MWRIVFRFINFYFTADTRYTVHSPFVFDFVKNVLEDSRLFYAYHSIETHRKFLLKNHKKIEVTDLGAGSKYSKQKQRSIRQIAQSALSSPRFCRILFKLCHHYQAQRILEMGTSLGISAAYLHSADTRARLITMEGCPNIAEEAKKLFKTLKLKKIEIRVGDFEKSLEEALQSLGSADLIFFDGNHRKAPTLAYFEKAMKYAQESSIFIFDDIYWSEEMMETWEQLKQDQRVRLSIDLFDMGLLFFRSEFKEKQHFKLVPWWWKPWRMGFIS